MSGKSNQITAIRGLLEPLYPAGCQKDIARTIVECQAESVLVLRGNQGQFHEDVKEWVERAKQTNFKASAHTYRRFTKA